MAYNERLAERAREILAAERGVSERKMFGGLAFMVGGNMCCGVHGDELMVRVGPERHDEALQSPHARPMDFTGRPMKGFVFVDGRGVGRQQDLRKWIGLGSAFASSLPRK